MGTPLKMRTWTLAWKTSTKRRCLSTSDFFEDFKTSHPDDYSESDDGEFITFSNAGFRRSTRDLVGNFLRNLLWPVIEHDSKNSDSSVPLTLLGTVEMKR